MGGAGGLGGTITTGGQGGDGGIQEPPGPPQLSVVNGTVDEDAIRICFVPFPDGPSAEMPWPDGDRLDFAGGAVIPIDDVIPTGTDVEVVLVAGSLAATDGMNCADVIDSPPSGVIARSLGLLPESVFTTEKSILLATAGCVGGRDHTHENEELICGAGYTVDQPTATLVAGFMSRLTENGRIPLQFVQASLAIDDVQLRVKPGNGSTAQPILTEWTFGAIAPYPPYTGLGTENLGNVGTTSIELYLTGSQSPLVTAPWSQAFANGTVLEDDVQNGVGLTFVAVGPTPNLTGGAWWNGFAYSALLSDP
jgi:hypothetical protein